jgi:anti-sigma-K factor RskA
MIDERTEEDAVLHALGLLSAEEARRFEERMESDPELRGLVRDMEETAASLALTAPPHEAPPQVRTQLLAALQREAAAGRPASAACGMHVWVPWALAAALAVAAGLLALERGKMQREVAALRREDHVSKLRIATLTSQVENAAGSVGAVAWDSEQQRGVLTIEKLPPLDPSQDYQLWVIDPNYKQPISGGIVRVDETGAARLVFTVDVPIRAADKFAISRERKGGVPQVEGPIVMAGQ